MSLHPIPSLRSSVGSKSTNAPVVCSGGGGEGGAGEEDSFYCHPDERSRALGSFWINRLQLQHLSLPPASRPAPAPAPLGRRTFAANTVAQAASEAGDGAGVASQNNKHTISTDESCTPTSISNFNSLFVLLRYGDLLGRRTAGFLRSQSPPPRIVCGDGSNVSVRGFGPFQVRSRDPGLHRETEGSLCRDLDHGRRVLGKGDYGHAHGGCFPLVRRMAHLGEALIGERGMLGFHFGRASESVHDEEDELNQGNACFPSRRSPPYARNQVKLSPFFQLRPSYNPDYSIDKGKGTVSLSIEDGSPAILQQRDPMRPIGHEHWRMPVPMSCFHSQDLVDDSLISRRAYEQNFLINSCHAGSLPVQHVTRSRGAVYHDGVDAAAPVREYGVKGLDKVPVSADEPEELFSFWNMGRFNRRNTVSSAAPTELRNNLGLKRSSNFETSFPQKFTRLSNED